MSHILLVAWTVFITSYCRSKKGKTVGRDGAALVTDVPEKMVLRNKDGRRIWRK
jgi:hypothetical protein